MKIKAQISMVMNLDKCIGCHTCSVTCKNAWTNRPGAEYMYFNNVETKPGIGYPKNWENQEKWKGGWQLKKGELTLASGSKAERLLKIFYHPQQPELDDYYEPWTYDYETLIHSKRKIISRLRVPVPSSPRSAWKSNGDRTGRMILQMGNPRAMTITFRRCHRRSRWISMTSS